MRDSFAEFCDAVPTRVHRRSDTKLTATCPVCRRKWKLTAAPKGGQVVFTAHCGCAKESVLDALGLTWADLYDERAYVPKNPYLAPSDQVMRCMTGERIALRVHRTGDEIERTAILVIEVTLHARYLAERRFGLSYPFDRFPMTNGWIRRVLRWLGIEVTDRELRKIGKCARALLNEVGGYAPEKENAPNWVKTFRLVRGFAASCLRSDHATTMLLSYTEQKSSSEWTRIAAFREALERIRDPARPIPQILAGCP